MRRARGRRCPALALCASLPAAAESPASIRCPGCSGRRRPRARTNYAGTVDARRRASAPSTSRITHLVRRRHRARADRVARRAAPRDRAPRRPAAVLLPGRQDHPHRPARHRAVLSLAPARARRRRSPRTTTCALGEVERVLGQDCQWIHLDPKDALRYAQRLCAELGSGLLLRAKTLGAKQQVLEQYAFTDLRLGRDVSRGELKSTFQSQSKDWRRDDQPLDEPDAGCHRMDRLRAAARLPAGGRDAAHAPQPPAAGHAARPQRRVRHHERVRRAHGPRRRAPARPRARRARSRSSPGPMGEYLVTVLGEVPPAAAQQVGRSVVRQAAAGSRRRTRK